jgi:hypothetical protein
VSVLWSHTTGAARTSVQKLLSETGDWDIAPKTLGKNAFFAPTDLGAYAAIAIDRLYVLRGRKWVELTLSGRLGPDGSQNLLVTAAKAVPVQLS